MLDCAEFYKKLKRARDGYEYITQAVNHQQDEGDALEVLQVAKFVLV